MLSLALNKPSSNGQRLEKRRSIGDDISHHRVDHLPSSSCGTSVSENANNRPTTYQNNPTTKAVASLEGAREAARYARLIARDAGGHSSNFDPRKEIAIPRFLPHEIVLGSKLGRGGFSNVYEIVRFDLREHTNKSKGAVQRPNLLGGDGEGNEMVGVPIGGALSDSHRALMARRHRGTSNCDLSSQSSLGGASSNRNLGNNNAMEKNDSGDANADDNDITDDISENSSSDDDVPSSHHLERICRRLSNHISSGSANKGIANGKSSSGDEDDGEVVHPILQRGESTVRFSSYHTRAREFLDQHAIRDAKSKNEPSTPRYAIKRLRADVMEDDDAYRMGAADLVLEARFLACLQHPNIVKIRGMTHGDCDAFASGIEGDYFLILDRLSESLAQRIKSWKKETKLSKGKRSGIVFDRRGRKWNSLLAKRLGCGYEIANALKYLHSKNIIFRDLKPDNVGFDCRGDVKIFDFGLAKEMRDDERVNDPQALHENGRPSLLGGALQTTKMFTDVYEMSAPCGSYRYMSPEVMLSKPYNFSADTFSFAVLLYEISMLKKPYAKMSREELIQKVAVEKYRPELPAEGRAALPSSLRTYLNLAWSDNLRCRPTMEYTCGTLFECLETLKEVDDDNESKKSNDYEERRSTYILKGASLRSLYSNGRSSRNLMNKEKIGSNRNLFKRRSPMPTNDSVQNQ